jgi:hypothetical protein
MTLIGIKVKINEGIINYYSKPFLLDYDKDLFIAQLIRDVDFSILLKKNDSIELQILVYPNRTIYQNLNIKNSEHHNLAVLGTYNFIFHNFNENYDLYEFKKTSFNKTLNNELKLEIFFSVIYIDSNDEYIVSTPTLRGSKKYLELN